MAATTATGIYTEPPKYADLDAIDQVFEAIDVATQVYQHVISRAAYTQRATVTQRIPHFWPLVFEQSPAEVDQHIQPSDSALFASSLLSMVVDRFQVPSAVPSTPAALGSLASIAQSETEKTTFAEMLHERASDIGEPRSLLFRFEFTENEYFEDRVLEKRFWYRRAKSGWSGRVSVPVRIRWRKGKDLTDGLNDAACDLYDAQVKMGETGDDMDKVKEQPEYKRLMAKVEASTEGSMSFFTWFGYRGPWIGEKESTAFFQEAATNASNKDGEHDDGKSKSKGRGKVETDEEDADEFDDDPTPATEIFPDGEDLAIALAEDVWPSALRYFGAAQEDQELDDEDMSAGSFDEDEMIEEMEGLEDEGAANMEQIKNLAGRAKSKDGPPSKKRKA